jgi:hypothetical protein
MGMRDFFEEWIFKEKNPYADLVKPIPLTNEFPSSLKIPP